MTENEELLKKLFAEKDFKPNDAQYRAITHIEGPLFLTARPGSRKSRVLLWYSNEGRKIVCAQKHFKAVGIEYKFVDDKDPYWYVPNKENYSEVLFGDKNTLLEKAKKHVNYGYDNGEIWGAAAEDSPKYEGGKK